MASWSDEQLIKSVLNGNQTHAKLLYERHAQYIAKVIWRRIANKEQETVRDLTQDVFSRAFKNLHTFKGDSAFKTWLVQIAVNRCKDHNKNKGNQFHNSHESHDEPDSPYSMDVIGASHGKGPEQQLIQEELRERFLYCLEQLPVKQRSVCTMLAQEIQYNEIAEELDISEGTVASRIYHARLSLKKCLDKYLKGGQI